MLYVENPFGTDIAEIQEANAGDRIGRRIRRVREDADPAMSQGELGEKVGLNANRIQQYENGARKPKLALLKEIAKALGVETAALADPDPSNDIGIMYTLFELETQFGLKPIKAEDGQIYLTFGTNDHINSNLRSWYDARQMMEVAVSTAGSDEEKAKALHDYHTWEWTFPRCLAEASKERRKQIAELQAKLNELKGDSQND